MTGQTITLTPEQLALHWRLAQEAYKQREAAAGLDMLPLARRIWRLPTHAELVAARATTRSCKCDRCSTCIRQAAAARNRARYGQDDYPGTGHAR